jgi:hypothetical protein
MLDISKRLHAVHIDWREWILRELGLIMRAPTRKQPHAERYNATGFILTRWCAHASIQLWLHPGVVMTGGEQCPASPFVRRWVRNSLNAEWSADVRVKMIASGFDREVEKCDRRQRSRHGVTAGTVANSTLRATF